MRTVTFQSNLRAGRKRIHANGMQILTLERTGPVKSWNNEDQSAELAQLPSGPVVVELLFKHL